MKRKIVSIGIVFLLIIGSFGAFATRTGNCNCINLNLKKEENSRDNNYALGLLVDHLKDDPDLPEPITLLGNPPSSWDWRNVDGKNWITPIRDQAYCGSCWAFGAVAALEAFYNIKNNDSTIDLDLSEQFLVSCNTDGDGGSVMLGRRTCGVCRMVTPRVIKSTIVHRNSASP